MVGNHLKIYLFIYRLKLKKHKKATQWLKYFIYGCMHPWMWCFYLESEFNFTKHSLIIICIMNGLIELFRMYIRPVIFDVGLRHFKWLTSHFPHHSNLNLLIDLFPSFSYSNGFGNPYFAHFLLIETFPNELNFRWQKVNFPKATNV